MSVDRCKITSYAEKRLKRKRLKRIIIIIYNTAL